MYDFMYDTACRKREPFSEGARVREEEERTFDN